MLAITPRSKDVTAGQMSETENEIILPFLDIRIIFIYEKMENNFIIFFLKIELFSKKNTRTK